MSVVVRAGAVAFDMDGTLIESRLAIETLWREWAAERGLNGESVLARAHGRPGAATTGDFIDDPAEARAEWARLLERAKSARDGIRAVPGAAAILAALPPDRWTIVTASERDLSRRWLALAGLPAAARPICAEDVRAGKPDPEGFLKAAQSLGVAPDRLVVFEDSLNGLRAARAAGAVVFGVGEEARRSGLALACLDDFRAVRVTLDGEDLRVELPG
jgi:sugar-phosphatase